MDEEMLKEVAVNLLMFDQLYLPNYTIYDDPDYMEACRQCDELLQQIEKEFPKEEKDIVKELMNLKIVTEGYMRFELFHTGLKIGTELCEKD